MSIRPAVAFVAAMARRHSILAVGLVLLAAVATVWALTAARAENDQDTGAGSPTACLSANVTGTIDSGDPGQSADLVTVQAGAGNVVSMICIKTGQDIFDLGGTGDCANVATMGSKSSHSPCIFTDGQYADGPCYAVAGMGTSKVTVSRKLATCPMGSGISHVDFLAKPTATPVTPTDTPVTPTDTFTPTVTRTFTPTVTRTIVVGGFSVDPDQGALTAQTAPSSDGGAGLLAAVTGASAAAAVALGAAGWYARRRVTK